VSWTLPAGARDNLGNPLLHEQTLVGWPSGIWVDTKLAELLKMLWARGLKTRLSCQGEDEPHPVHGWIPAYIVFADEDSAQRFLDGSDVGPTLVVVNRCGEFRVEWLPQDTQAITQAWKDRSEQPQ
jgi:hypothetical protein